MEEYAARLDRQPPAELIEKMKGRGDLGREYLIYRADRWRDPLTGLSEKAVRVTCTACGESWLADYVAGPGCSRYAAAPFGFMAGEEAVISGRDTICPACGHPATAMHIGQMGSCIERGEACMSWGRLDDKLVLYGWYVQRLIDKDAKSWWSAHPYEAYVYGARSSVRLTGFQRTFSAVHFYNHWEQRKRWQDVWGSTAYTYGDIPLEGSAVERSRLDLYIDACKRHGVTAWPVSYLRLWQRHPQVENLLVQGAGKLLADLLDRERTRCVGCYGQRPTGIPEVKLNWKERQPAKLLGLTRPELRAAVRLKWSERNLEAYKLLREREPVDLEDESVTRIIAKRWDWIESLAEDEYRGKVPVLRCCRYLEKQNRRPCAEKLAMDARYLWDYWRMARLAGWDLTDPSRLLPKDLHRAHDKALAESEEARCAEKAARLAEEIQKRAPEFAKRAAELERFAWERDGILIRPCRDEAELIREGELLHHCVAGYAGPITRGASAIFFVRQASEPDKPWYTLELDEQSLTVRQNRGSHNCARVPEVETFEAEWLEHIKTVKKKGEKAA